MFALLASVALGSTWPALDEPLRTGASAEGAAAVVIGVEDYAFVQDVPYAARDARAFYDVLVYTRGIPADRVQLLDQLASREKILGAIERAAAQAAPDGEVWVYFAGHGAASPADGERLLLGDDVRPDPEVFASRGVAVREIKERLAGRSAILVIDACYTGAGRGGGELVPGHRFAVPAYATVPTGGILEWSAAAPSETSGPLEAVRHGAFTYFAAGALRGWADGEKDGARDGVVSAEEADLYVRRALRAAQITAQTPQLTGPREQVLSRGKSLESPPDVSAPVNARVAIEAPGCGGEGEPPFPFETTPKKWDVIAEDGACRHTLVKGIGPGVGTHFIASTRSASVWSSEAARAWIGDEAERLAYVEERVDACTLEYTVNKDDHFYLGHYERDSIKDLPWRVAIVRRGDQVHYYAQIAEPERVRIRDQEVEGVCGEFRLIHQAAGR